MSDIERYRSAIRFIDGLANLSPVFDYMRDHKHPQTYLERTRYFLGLCGDPHKGFKYVHVTGTSGKGTVTTMVHESLRAAGKCVGSFTSPFATAATEKIRVDDLYIAPGDFADIFEEIKPHIERMYLESSYGRPAYFEIFLVIAFIYFKRQKCDWVVLEVGAGGRYDATNVIETPVATAITSIDYDHMQILGRSLKAIAETKAGVIKKGSTFFTTEARAVLLDIFKNECKTVGASFTALSVSDDYQENNKTLARAICRHIGLSEEAIEQGIAATRLSCRFEIMSRQPLVVLDGAHNRAKMRATADSVRKIPHKRLHLILGLKNDKDPDSVLKEIVPLAQNVYITRFQNVGIPCAEPKELAGVARKHITKDVTLSIHLYPHDALDQALKATAPDDLVLVTGSFYLAGDLRKRWFSEEYVVRERKSF